MRVRRWWTRWAESLAACVVRGLVVDRPAKVLAAAEADKAADVVVFHPVVAVHGAADPAARMLQCMGHGAYPFVGCWANHPLVTWMVRRRVGAGQGAARNVHFSFVCRRNCRGYHLAAPWEPVAVRLQRVLRVSEDRVWARLGGVVMPYRVYAVGETRLRGGKPRVYAEFWLRAIRELWSHR
jgi:hypothetical protein